MVRLTAAVAALAVLVSAMPCELTPLWISLLEPSALVAADAPCCPCSEPGENEDDPCDMGCLSPCGAATSLAPPACDLAVDGPKLDTAPAWYGAERLPHPSELIDRLFRPPRPAAS